MRVGFVDLGTQTFAWGDKIEYLLRDRWLDPQTAFEFKKELEFCRRHKNPSLLERLHDKIKSEIRKRKERYGATL